MHSNDKLPKKFNPTEFAKQRLSIQGVAFTSDMSRLLESCSIPQEIPQIELELSGHANQIGQLYLTGKFKVVVTLLCQRCLKAMQFPIQENFRWQLVFSDLEEQEISSHSDTVRLLSDKQELNLLNLLEEEIILALPLIPKHSHCLDRLAILGQNDNFTIKPEGPFDKLADLKNNPMKE